MFEDIEWLEADGVVTIRLNRPEALNALTHTMRRELKEALEEADRNASIRVVVLRGAGRAFCVGQDLREMASYYQREGPRLGKLVEDEYIPLVLKLRQLSKPTVAVVEGPAVGGGMALALATDFRVISARAQLVPAFVNVGLAPDTGTTFLLSRAVGYARALSYSLKGQAIQAEEMVALGLAEGVAATADEVESILAALVNRLKAGPTVAYAAIRRLFDDAQALPLKDVLARERDVQEQLAGTQDHQEAVQAFLEKRTPEFRGQ
ncbi:MAG: enoyl-CoA hydratase-related protein [Firmicutes bacterium]|nr:enoyl-CoA hydratase-related protein [Bacillota bacterium]